MMKYAHINTLLTAGAGLVALGLIAGCASSSTSDYVTFDPQTRRLAPCPDTPNCVSTEDTDVQHGIAPLTYTGDVGDAKARMLEIIHAMPRSTVVTSADDYIHAEFRSRIFRFVDDVEIYFRQEPKQIDFRSASRVGHSDLGVNRKRMEEIGRKFGEGN